MGSKVSRIGEERLNNFSSKMIVVGYKKAIDINVYFPEYNWTAKNVTYQQFKKGEIKCPYEPRVCGHGYIGEGKYKVSENGKRTKCYIIWKSMLIRCYDPKYHEKYPTYINCEVCKEWLNFQNFSKWYYENYYEIEGQKMCLDKDILHKRNKIYSPDTCVFVPNNINVLFTKNDKIRGDYPIGVSYNKQHKKFASQCRVYDFKDNKRKYRNLGYYDTPKKAFEVYKEFKEKHIKEVAEYYKRQIPQKLYKAMYDYEVNIND